MNKLNAVFLLSFWASPSLADAMQDDPERQRTTTSRRTENEASSSSPSAQTLGRDQSGVFVNSTAANSGYSPTYVMRGFPSGFPLFDGASHGFTAQDIDLSTIDHVEFYKGPSAMLFGKALGGYGGAADYIRKAPVDGEFVDIVASAGAFDVRRLTVDINTRSTAAPELGFRMTASAQTVGSFVDFVRSRSFDVAPMAAWRFENGDRVTLRAEHNGARLVWRDGVPAAPIFLRVPREFYAGASVNEHETPIYDDLTLTYEHTLGRNWKLSAVVDYFLYGARWGWFTGWGYDGFRSLQLGRPARTRVGNRSFDAQLRLEGRLETGPVSHDLFLGRVDELRAVEFSRFPA